MILYKTKRNPGPSESFDFERVPGFVRCILEGLLCRSDPHLLETLHVQQAALFAGAKLERSSDKGLEQRVSAVGTALELRMELCAQMEVTAGQFHSLHQTTVRAGAGNDKTGILHFLTEFVVELVAVAVALPDRIRIAGRYSGR